MTNKKEIPRIMKANYKAVIEQTMDYAMKRLLGDGRYWMRQEFRESEEKCARGYGCVIVEFHPSSTQDHIDQFTEELGIQGLMRMQPDVHEREIGILYTTGWLSCQDRTQVQIIFTGWSIPDGYKIVEKDRASSPMFSEFRLIDENGLVVSSVVSESNTERLRKHNQLIRVEKE